MENLKVKVNNWDESKEVQELFFELGFEWFEETKRKIHADRIGILFTTKFVGVDYLTYDKGREFSLVNHKELTIPQLRDLVILKRNDMGDATHKHHGCLFYVDSEGCLYQHMTTLWFKQSNEHWNLEEIKKHKIEKEMKMKEYLGLQEDGSYKLVIRGDDGSTTDIKVPEGAEIFLLDEFCGEDTLYFVKHDGYVFHEYYISGTNTSHNTWIKGTIKELHDGMGKVLWQRNALTTLDSKNTSTQDKLKFIEKWLNGEKIQYILGIETEKSQWHNFTEGAMQYIKRSDIKFREAPKYVTINGVEFKNVESLLKHVKNNFDLEDGE